MPPTNGSRTRPHGSAPNENFVLNTLPTGVAHGAGKSHVRAVALADKYGPRLRGCQAV